MLEYPHIDPVAFSLGPLAIRWYGLAYVAGMLGGWSILGRLAERKQILLDVEEVNDLLVWVMVGVVAGGRLGYVLFYKPAYYLANPMEAPMLWQGGMSFHGGLLGVAFATAIFCFRRELPFLAITDALSRVTPIGLFMGRLANFANGELWGRVTSVPWGMVFPTGGPEPRHPSQLYEAGLEGIALFCLINMAAWFARKPAKGLLTGVFLLGYALSRIVAEAFREPDAFLGFIIGRLTMGQLLSAPMAGVGAWLVLRALFTRSQPDTHCLAGKQ